MSVLNQLASALDRRDEEPNIELATRLRNATDVEEVREDIQELVDNLKHPNKGIRSDCIKVLYEIGAVKPEYIEDYVDEFVAILTSRDNRLVWGGMTALGSIASRKPQEIWGHVETIMEATTNGSVITQDWGVRVLATVAATDERYREHTFPFLIAFLEECRPKDVPRHAESILVAVKTTDDKNLLRTTLEEHIPQLKPSQLKRVERVMRQMSE